MSENSKKILFYSPYPAFFLIMFLFLFFFADHIFYFQENNALFILSLDSLYSEISVPGGLLNYLSGFLTSLFYYPLAGALITASVITLILILIVAIMKQYGIKNRYFAFLAACVLFWLQTSYKYYLFNSFGILLQLGLFNYLIRRKNSWLPVIIFPLWYFITGGFSWIFFIMYILHAGITDFRNNRVKIIVLPMLSFALIWFLAEFIFFESVFNLLSRPWTGEATGEHSLAFLVITILISLIPAIRLVKFLNPPAVEISAKVLQLTDILLVLILSAGISWISYDPVTRNYFHSEKLFHSQKYTELIRFNTQHPTTNYLTLFENNIALCETGRLNDMLFWFPQSAEGKTLFQKWEMVGEILRSGGHFYYTIGMVNEAHRWAYEYMVAKGNNPEELKMLIRTDIINGNYKTAQAYINLLKKTLFYRKTALRYEKLLYDDRAVENDPELGPKRKTMPKRDFFATSDDPLLNLRRIVASDSLNRPAFDYLMAYLLITKDYANIAGEWPSLSRYDYGRIPLHIEEAGIAINSLDDPSLPKANIRVSPETEQRFAQFLQTFQSFGSDPRAAEPALRRNFGNTYWYYVFYK